MARIRTRLLITAARLDGEGSRPAGVVEPEPAQLSAPAETGLPAVVPGQHTQSDGLLGEPAARDQ